MSLFKPENKIIPKPKENTHHPWQRRIKDAYSSTYKYAHNSVNNPVHSQKDVKTNPLKPKYIVTVIGNRCSKEFIFCYYLVKGLYKYKKRQFEQPVIRGVSGIEWPRMWTELKNRYGTPVCCIHSQVVVLINDKFIGGEEELKKFVDSKYVYYLCIDYYKEAIQQLANYINVSGRPCAYLHISLDGKEIGTFIIMLYADIVPRTCENFLRLCATRKGGYTGTPIHRIVKDSWIQCGGFALQNNPDLGCENFIIPHDRRGLFCMANDGRDVECSTQFFVLLQPAPWMEHKYVAFGQLIEGEETLSKIESVPTWYESPTKKVIIYKAGVFNMQCEYIPVNKNTNEYLSGHIEDLVELGDLLYQQLLDKVFMAIELKLLGEENSESKITVGAQNLHATKRFIRKKAQISRDNGSSTSESSTSSGNKDFDVDVYEYEDYSYSQVTPSLVVKPSKPYYLPMTDVPYPGEVDSSHDLKSFLRGDLCYHKDINEEEDCKRKPETQERRLSIPETLIGALFDCFYGEDETEINDLDSDDETLVKNYVSENTDTISFAGPVIKNIANVRKKYDIFDIDKQHNVPMTKLLTDEDLRLIRMATKEFYTVREKKVSICLSSAKLSQTRIIRRPTAYIKRSDLEKFHVDSETFESLEEYEEEQENEVEIVKKRPSDMFKQTAFNRLLESVPNLTEREPTFRSLHSQVKLPEASYEVLYHEPVDHLKRMQEKSSNTGDHLSSIDHLLLLQHGKRIYRKFSSDYVRTIDHLEHIEQPSIRTLEYKKVRPSISVAKYKLKNKIYHDQLKYESKKSNPE